MPVPIYYRRNGEPSVASYDFFDIAQGSGIITLYGAIDQNTTGTITNSSTYSDKIVTNVVPTAGAVYNKDIDIDFDTTLNMPLNLKGTASICIPAVVNVAGGNSSYIYCVVYIRKYSNAVETDIVSGASSVVSSNGVTLVHEPMVLVKLAVPNTHFKKGDVLRITVEGWTKASAGGMVAAIAHDPKNRTPAYPTGSFTTGMPTNMIFNLPVKIDL